MESYTTSAPWFSSLWTQDWIRPLAFLVLCLQTEYTGTFWPPLLHEPIPIINALLSLSLSPTPPPLFLFLWRTPTNKIFFKDLSNCWEKQGYYFQNYWKITNHSSKCMLLYPLWGTATERKLLIWELCFPAPLASSYVPVQGNQGEVSVRFRKQNLRMYFFSGSFKCWPCT